MPDIEIYIGSPIEYASERAVLERLAELLSKEERDTIILANIHLSGRQIDLVLALEGLTLVIEAKSSASPLRGGTNGRWEVRVASGGWKHIDNHYRQTLGAAYALRDAMNRFDSAHTSTTPRLRRSCILPPPPWAVGAVRRTSPSCRGSPTTPQLVQQQSARSGRLKRGRRALEGARLRTRHLGRSVQQQIPPARSAGALFGGGRTDSHDRTAQVHTGLRLTDRCGARRPGNRTG
jgi:Nuclease-related domain